MKKPIYTKIQESPDFLNREQAEDWAKGQKKIYKQSGQSLRYDIKKSDSQNWKATVSAKV